MITFDYLTLKALSEENLSFFKNARIQKIQAPTRKDLILSLRNNGETKKFYINIDPQNYHICLMSKENEAKRCLEIPQKPTMFCMLLRKYLENSKISRINVPPYERIFEIYIETYNELGDKIYLCLAVELMGKYSNIILYNHDTNVIIGCCHNVGEEKSRNREMAGLLPYVYPPKQSKIDILEYNGEVSNLNEKFYGISKALENQIKNNTLEQIKNFIKLKNITPAISSDFSEYTLFSELINTPVVYSSVNSMTDDYFTFHQVSLITKSLKQRLFSIINPKYKKILGSLEKIDRQIKKEEKSKIYRIYGDLLMANLHTLKDFTPTVKVFDWNTNSNTDIPIDETKTIKENANKFYKLYNKAKTSSSKLFEIKEKLSTDKIYLEEILFTIEQAKTINVLKEISDEISDNKSKNTASIIYEETFNDYKIYIGQNNKQNDLIVSKLSDKDDLWFHTKDCPGSHVLLKNPLRQAPSDDVVLYCAKLAKQYSQAKNSPKAGVIYTYRKNLKKPPAANLGYVIYKNETEIMVD